MRFLHMADVHLGNQQYNLKERFNDFGLAFLDAVHLAVEQDLKAVVIAGDLFHKASVEPVTLLQAEAGLHQLRDAGIPVVVVHGNHDKARYLAQYSWLEYLCEQGLMCLLAPDMTQEPLQLLPWDDEQHLGSYVDVENVRFVGVPWLGAAAPRVLEEVAQALDGLKPGATNYTVLITHAGVEGQMPNMPGGLSFDQLAPLRSHVNYLALGHLHKPYSVDNWIFNPGSLETCSFDEVQYARGCYVVEVDGNGGHDAKHVPNIQRPFFSLDVKTDQCATPEALVEAVTTQLRQERRTIERQVEAMQDDSRRLPIVRLVLRGNLTFDRAGLDLDAIRKVMQAELDALHVRVENRTTPLGVEITIDESLGRAALERMVFETLVAGNSQYSNQKDVWAGFLQHVKVMALDGDDPAAIFGVLDALMDGLEEGDDVDHEAAA